MLRLSVPSVGRDEQAAVAGVLKSGFFVQGKQVAAFEKAVASYVGAKHAVAVNSGTSALHLALLALGIGPGDEVIVPDFTFPATANVVELTGATPVIADVQAATANVDAAHVERLISRKTKAIMPVHLFGQSADMRPLLKLARRHSLAIVEDAACVLGATFNGRSCGTWGEIGCYSFHPRKVITTGEGGILVTNRAAVAEKLRLLRNHGLLYNTKGADFLLAGYNYRMTEIEAAIGLVQMRKINRIIKGRRRVAREYDRQLAGLDWVTVPQTGALNTHVYQAYVVTLSPRIDRNRLIAHLKEQGIEANFGTYAMHRLEFYKTRYRLNAKNYPVSEQLFKSTLALPLFEHMTTAQVGQVAKALAKFQ